MLSNKINDSNSKSIVKFKEHKYVYNNKQIQMLYKRYLHLYKKF